MVTPQKQGKTVAYVLNTYGVSERRACRVLGIHRALMRYILTRPPLPKADGLKQIWRLDFVSDALSDGRRFRILSLVDQCSQECLALVVDTSLSAVRVA